MELFLKIVPLDEVIAMEIASAPAAPVAPVAPVRDFAQDSFLTKVCPFQLKDSVISPLSVAAAPSVPFAATVMTKEPSAEVVAAVLLFFVMPEGSVGSVSVQALRLVP